MNTTSMRTLIGSALLFLLLSCFMFLGLSWDGDLNPTEFDKWEVVHVWGSHDQWIVAKNPDETSKIDFAALVYENIVETDIYGNVTKLTKKLVEYRYFKDGEPYVLYYIDKIGEFRSIEIPDWKREECYACHKEKFTPKKI